MIPFHPYAEMFPMITHSDFSEMIEDVRRHGLRERIVVYEGKILDGRNRYNAALATGLLLPDDEPDDRPMLFQKFVAEIDGNALDYVVSKNIHRRHLTTGQRAYAMAEYEVFRHGGARKAGEADANLRLDLAAPTRAELAETGKVSERSIASAATVRDHGIDDLKSAVRDGDIAVSAAEKIARLPEDLQPQELARHLPNGSRSIMSSRQEPDDSLDYFPTPPWATRALIERVFPAIGVSKLGGAWEPACGEGHIAEVLAEYSDMLIASDVFDYGYGAVQDFLQIDLKPPQVDWLVTNPPFGENAMHFVRRALSMLKHGVISTGVAMFFRSQWAVEGIERYEEIFRDRPPTLCAFFVERVNLCKGRWEPDGSTATAYCWLVWIKGKVPQPPFWIPPGCRDSLTHPDDVDRFTAHPVIKRIIPTESRAAMSGTNLNGALAYLATPYTKYPPGFEQAFIDAAKLAALLLRAGINVYSPIAHTHPLAIHGGLDPLDHSIWMPFDQAMMNAADVLIVAHMEGWQASYGVAEEIRIFEEAGKPIFDLDPKTLVMTKRRGPLVYESNLAHNKTASEQGAASA